MKKQTKHLSISHRRDCFQLSMDTLAKNSTLPHKSSLQNYHPLIDEVGILRAGGRLEHSHLAYSRHHPILLYMAVVMEHYLCGRFMQIYTTKNPRL